MNLSLPVLNQVPLAGLLLRNNRLPRHGTLALSKFFEIYTNLTCLAACNNIESKDDCVSLAQAMRHHPCIESLILHHIGLGRNRSLMTAIMPAIHNRTLEAVSLEGTTKLSFESQPKSQDVAPRQEYSHRRRRGSACRVSGDNSNLLELNN